MKAIKSFSVFVRLEDLIFLLFFDFSSTRKINVKSSKLLKSLLRKIKI